jgi:glutathionylspermidine synthase
METGTQIEHFNNYYEKNREEYLEDYHQLFGLLETNDIKYGTQTLWCELAPVILSCAERAMIQAASEAVIQAAECFTNIVVDTPGWQKHYDWPDEFWQLVRADPGYSHNIPCARFDSFLNGNDLTFIELNTDGCSGMTNADTFHKLYFDTIESKQPLHLREYTYDRVVPNVLDSLLNCYSEFRENTGNALPEKPVIGILDWADEQTNWEFNAFARFCEQQGYRAYVVSPGQADYRNGTLFFDDIQIHLVYRRLLGDDYAGNLETLKPVSTAFLDKAVCMVGTPRSQIAFSKKLFAFLHDPGILKQLPEETAGAVTEHVPWTRELLDQETEFRGESIDLIPFIKEHKEHFVIKPCVSKCGYGIYQGIYTQQDEWCRAVDEAISSEYIAQEFVTIPTADYPRYTPGKEYEKRYIHLGEYVFGAKFSGILGRTCADPLLNLRHGERLLAVLYEHGCDSI